MTDELPAHGNFIDREIPAFDGIRGIAIIMVMTAHAGFGPERAFLLFPPGVLGVDIFMVLSGFLIASVLLKDIHTSGSIRFAKFYFRRAARILPALLTFLLSCWAISAWAPHLVSDEVIKRAAFGALTFTLNLQIVSECTLYQPLAHLWSLSLEEQFYLIFPLTMALLLRLRSRLLCIGIALLPVALSMAIRYPGCLMWNGDICWNTLISFGSASHFIGQTVGAIFACLWRFRLVDVNSARSRACAGIAVLGGALSLVAGSYFSMRSSCAGLDIICLASLGLIVMSLETRTSPIKNVLLNPFLRYTGRISYGLYLWHIVLLWVAASELPLPRLTGAALAIIVSYGLATASYYFLELPVLRAVRGTLRQDNIRNG